MNYRHIFHAGNFADVLKHIVLIRLINHLKQKPSQFCYLETHAGRGLYDLFDEEARKTEESREGILKILHAPNPPPLVQQYLKLVRLFNEGEVITHYPGSPLIAGELLREHDRMILCEWHFKEYQELKKFFHNKHAAAIHHQNGYVGLTAFLPPKERRGLILIDPPYENPHESQSIYSGLKSSIQRFLHGVYLVWYPIKVGSAIRQMMLKIAKESQKEKIIIELYTGREQQENELEGAGLLIINPPWQFDIALLPVCEWLNKAMFDNLGKYTIIK